MTAEIPTAAAEWISAHRAGAVVSATPVAGGCIHGGRIVTTSAGYRFFLKAADGPPPDLFPAEARGLELLASTGCLRVPAVLASGPDFLLLEDLAPGKPNRKYWPELGRRLACLHKHTADMFGLDHDNYLGGTPQPNTRTADGYQFFADRRLRYQAALAVSQGRLTTKEARQVEVIAGRLREWIPEQPASLIHGDLWSGNILADANGNPSLIDPAVHHGWREADLAMMALFGSPPEAFYKAYNKVIRLPPGLQERFPIYNLYHLLNHLNIFGQAYHAQVVAVLDRFVR